MSVKLTVDLSGPFFQGDPSAKLRDNIKRMHAGLVQEGERLVRQVLAAGQSGRQPLRNLSPDRVAGHVHGRVESLAGKPWRASGVISVNNRGLSSRQGVSLMAAASDLETRLKPFRRVSLALGRSRPVLSADLAKGLN